MIKRFIYVAPIIQKISESINLEGTGEESDLYKQRFRLSHTF